MLETYHRGEKKQLDSAPPGTVGEGEETSEADSNKQTKKKKQKSSSRTTKNEEVELLPIVQYSPSLHNIE